MTTDFKKQVQEKLTAYIAQKGSQNKAAHSLNGVSSALLSQIINDNWDQISETMWRNVASQIGHSSKEWVCVQTTDYKLITGYLNDAKQDQEVFAITGDAGSGKSKAFELYKEANNNTYLLSCSEYWNRKEFLVQLMMSIGIDATGLSIAEMVRESMEKILKKGEPLIILDEADKLSDTVLYFFITIYNKLEERCGLVLSATDYFEKRMIKGVINNRKGYREINSRFGGKVIKLKGVNFTDVTQVCIANGIESSKSIKEIFADSNGDLRRVRRLVKVHKNRV
jgi:Cdc6-like AAA superfamily ATPase